MRNRKFLIIIPILALLIGGIYFYTNATKEEVQNYLTEKAGPATIENSVSTTGSIVDEYTFNINADAPATLTKIAGTTTSSSGTPTSLSDTWLVSKINNEEGKTVSKNETIVTLKNYEGQTQLIKSPEKARVRSVNAVKGSPVAGTVATIGTGRLLVSVEVSETQSTQLSVGLPIALAINSSDSLTSGAITSIKSTPSISDSTPTYTVLINPTPNTLPVTSRAGMTVTVDVTPVGEDRIRITNAELIDEFTYDIDVNNKVTLSSKNGVDLTGSITNTTNTATKQWTVSKLNINPGSIVKKNEIVAVLKNFDGTTRNVKSPSDGTIREIFTAPNAIVSGAIASLGSGEVVAAIKVSEYDIPNVKLDQIVELKLGSATEINNGKVTQIGQVATVDNNGVSQFSVFAKPDALNETWRIGMSVTAKIILQSKDVSIAVPLQAIQRKGQEQFVQVLNEKNEPIDKVVQTGVSGTQLIEILSGISEGEEVILGKASIDGKLPVSEDPFREQRQQQRSNGGRNN